MQDDSIIHIAQSEYAADVLRQLGVKHLVKCTDIVNAEFYEQYEETTRSDTVLYNPAKATPLMRELMDKCDGITFRPITGMTRQEVIDAMRHSKLYIDFGEFPGRERMPREAVLCGCCIITSKAGSAAYGIDFLHEYKFDGKPELIWAIKNRIHFVLNHYDDCRNDFDAFRALLSLDANSVKEQVKEVVNEIQHHRTGV